VSAPQFTSGPWTANKAWDAHPRFGIFKDRNIVVGKAWTEEDARLIAAAPSLYEALVYVREQIGEPVPIARRAWVRRIDDALAKARGES
jgi:hypothetical protein